MIELLESEGSFGGLLFLLGEFYPLRLFKFETWWYIRLNIPSPYSFSPL